MKMLSGLVVSIVAAFTNALGAAEPRTIRDLRLTLMPISAGTFTMGSPVTEAIRQGNEGPQTQVTLTRPFWLGQTEVTHAQWRITMGTDLLEQVRRMLADDAPYLIAGKKQTLREFHRRSKDSDPRCPRRRDFSLRIVATRHHKADA